MINEMTSPIFFPSLACLVSPQMLLNFLTLKINQLFISNLFKKISKKMFMFEKS